LAQSEKPAKRKATRRREVSQLEYEQAVKLRLALQEFDRSSVRATRKYGLTLERYQLLLLIKTSEQRNEPVTVGELATTLGLAASTVTQLVRRTENLRLIRRELSDRDARIRYLRVTEEGNDRLQGAVAELRGDRSRVMRLVNDLRRIS
jgi:DNA-binding MarR family transcriptional regulator